MTIYFDPSKIKIEKLETDDKGNLVSVDSGETLADHYKTCSGCPYCD